VDVSRPQSVYGVRPEEDSTMTTNATGERTARFWLEECETALRRALEACGEARRDAERLPRAGGIRGDLASALHELDAHVGVARAATTHAMAAEGMRGGR
jgi:hypothetical protein